MPFSLSLLYYPQGCENNYFTDTSVNISGDTIYLRYVPRPSPEPVCAVDPYGPVFTLPALRGPMTYTVMATALPACLVDVPPCDIPEPPPVFAGLLAVTGLFAAPIWLNPNRAEARRAFTMVVQSREFQCNDLFISPRAGVAGVSLFLQFQYSQSAIPCPFPDTAVKSVSFPIPDPGLAFRLDGKYAVHWNPDTAGGCPSGSMGCSTQFQSAPFDTLFLYAPSPILPGRRVGRRRVLFSDGGFPLGLVRGYRVDGRKALLREK